MVRVGLGKLYIFIITTMKDIIKIIQNNKSNTMSSKYELFPPEVVEKLKNYVYRLIDPRNGETFYVGKGNENRVFSHVEGETKYDEVNEKITRIREIKLAGFEVAHVIHRHGMNKETALEVEAALIDAYPGLTNIQGGTGSNDFGTMHASEIIEQYRAQPAIFKHRALLININRSALDNSSAYEAVRFAWKLSKQRAQQSEVVLAVQQGIIRDAFIAEKWMDATQENFPMHIDNPGRIGFIGKQADETIANLYLGKRVPDVYRKRGAVNPIRYTW
jgi:hypothetical protein